VTATTPATYTNTIPVGGLTDTQNVPNGNAASASLVVNPASTTLAKSFSPNVIPAGGTSTLTIQIPNTGVGAVTLTNAALTDTLPAGITIASPTGGNLANCGAGTLGATAGGNTVALSGGTIAAGATCVITVNVTGTVAANYTNTIPANALTDTQGVSNPSPASAPLTINLNGIALSKAFAPTTIPSGGTSTLTITVPNTATGAVALSGMTLTDMLPAGVTVAATPNAATTCTGGTVAATAGGNTVGLSGGTVAANATCTITVSVTGTVANTYTNTIPANALNDTQGVKNPNPATAPLTITPAGLTLSKAFAPTTIASGGTSTLTITVPNTASGAINLTGVALTDTLPAGITIAATPNAATTCPSGTVAATAGGTSVALSGATLGANATCTITVSVTGTVANSYTNTIPSNALTDTQGVSNPNPATAPLTINPAGIPLAKAFAPTTIPSGGTSTLTITIPNTASGAINLTGMALTDTLPAGITIAATPNAATTCTGGTVAATAGGTTVALSGGSVNANATCTITVSVTGTIAANYTNTIPASALTDTQGVSNPAPATAPLTITPAGITLAKAFSPTTIPAGGTSTLTITIPNTAPGAISLTGLALTDTLPTNVTVAATPNAATTCPSGTVSATAGGSTVALSGGTLAANATCTITVSVTGTIAGNYTNTIPSSALTDTQNVSNPNPATAPLTITPATIGVSKAFAPTVIAPGGVSTLTITLPNTTAGAVNLTGMALTDTLPSGVTIAATPNAATNCGAGTVTATAGATSVALSGGSVAAGATCTITVNVTGTAVGTYTNTIPANAITTAQGATNPAPTTANLTIGVPSLAVVKTSNPSGASVSPGEPIAYTIVVSNNGSQPETNAKITDTLTNAALVPGSVTVNGASAPDAVVTAAQPFGTIAVGASATIKYSATVNANAAAGTQVTNSATAGGDQPCAGASCTSAPPANVVALPVLVATKTIDGKPSESVLPGQTVTYGITVQNNGTSPAINAVMTDPVPTGATPIAGTVTLGGLPVGNATIVGQTVTVPLGTIAAGVTEIVTFKAKVGSVGGALTNTVTVGATGLAQAARSNPVVASPVAPTL
ncbi:MAG: DUF11 domain-containing protein, partial [Candidatus Eremiobacteraeota bacterium]|nr:DUF11 domain-containing protein [Candidatus Eremiobacteraeota bacterium]